MRFKINYVLAIFSLFFGGIASWILKEEATYILFGGKTLENRSLFVQFVVLVFYIFSTSILIYVCVLLFSRLLGFVKSFLPQKLFLKNKHVLQRILDWHVYLVDKHPFYLYISLISILYITIYLPIKMNGNMYIYLDIGADTYASYWPMYAFIRDYFHSFQFSGWSFQHGLGANIFSTASPWIFDPYNIFIVPFDKGSIDTGLFLAASAKVFSLAILAFMYIRKVGYRGIPLIASSITYTFCGFFVGWGQHYQFATAFVLFTLTLYCMEEWLISSRWLGVILSTALLAAFWPYTFFMASLFLVAYYVFRYLILFGTSIPKLFANGVVTASLFFLGMSLSAISLLPQAYAIVQSPRMADHIFPGFTFASLKEYYTILTRLFSNGLLGVSDNAYKGFQNYYESPFLYNSILMIFLAPRLFFNDLRKKIYVWIVAVVVFALLFPHVVNPIFGALNKYSYRWTFVLVPIFSISLAESLFVVNDKAHKWVYFVIMLLGVFVSVTAIPREKNVQLPAMAANLPVSVLIVCVTCVLYGFFLYNFSKKYTSYIILAILMGEVALTGFTTVNLRGIVSASGKKNIPYYDLSTIQALHAISETDNEFYRVNKNYDYIYLTDALFQNFYGEKQYSSVIPSYIWEMQNIFDIRGFHSNYMFGFSDKQSLRDISAGKYMLSKKEHSYSGYEEMGHYGDVYVYKNNNATAIGVTYKNYIPVGEFKKLTWQERQYILYDAVVVPDEFGVMYSDVKEISTPFLRDGSPVSLLKDFSYVSSNLTIKENEFPRHFTFAASGDTSPRFCIKFLSPSDTSVAISFSMKTQIQGSGEIFYKTPESEDYDIKDIVSFDVEEGSHEYYSTVPIAGVDSVCLNLTGITGVVQFEDFLISHRNDNEIAAHAASLIKSSDIKDIIVDEDHISGIVDMDSSGLVYFSVPFDAGWKAYVDGVPVKKIKANVAFTGIYVSDGRHSVELKYTVPWLKEGIFISFVSLVLFFGIYAFTKYRSSAKSDHIK